MERLDKFLCDSGVGTRSQVKQILKTGVITVNGIPAKDGSVKIDPNTTSVCLRGQRLGGKMRMVLMLHKPAGYVTATEDKNDRTVMELLPAEYRHLELKPVGRLDKATEGLLLFTNDGECANMLMHPKHQVEKTYDTWVTGYDPSGLQRLSQPMELDGYRLRTPKLKLLKAEGSTARMQITIHEGRSRQVRRMCEIAGMKVTRLRRIREGSLQLGDLPKGKWRYLTAVEVAKLK